MITDDLFGGNPLSAELLTRLCDRYDFIWFAQSRAAFFLNNLDTWYHRGLRYPSIGAESMSQKVLNDIDKRQKVEEVIEFSRRTKEKTGMYRIVNYIIGYDNMTVEDTMEDIKRIKKLDCEAYGINIMTPFPKTQMWDKIQSQYGIFEKKYKKFDTQHLVWNHPYISPEKMHRLHRKAMRILNKPIKTYGKFISTYLFV